MFKNKLKYDIESWLDYKKITCKRSTYTNYVYMVNKRILPVFGKMKKKQINKKFVNN